MANEQLLSAANGNSDVTIRVSLKDQAFGDGGDHVPPGRYSLKIEAASWENKRGEKVGKNLKIVYSVAQPDGEWKNAKIVQYMAAPTGDPSSEEFAKAMKMVKNLLASVFSGAGQLDQARASDGFDFAPAAIVGKLCFAYLDDDEYKDVVKSRVVFHLPLEDYTKAPGPDPLAAGRKAVGSTAPAQKAAPTMTGGVTVTPNLLGGTTAPAETTPAPAHVPPSNGSSDPAARLLGLV